MDKFELAQNKLATQATLIRELVGVVNRALPYCGHFQLPPALIADMKAALSRVPAEYLTKD